MPTRTGLPEALIELQNRARSKPDFHAETGPVLHTDLYEYIRGNKDKGKGVIEIGSYKGASSIVLAYVCKELQMSFYTLDINQGYLAYTRDLLEELGLAAHTTFFPGSAADFAQVTRLEYKPLLVFVDGDHTYSGVVKDIKAIYQLNRRPYAMAFHDFSLRSFKYENINVDRAICDTFGQRVEYKRIGVQFGEHPTPSQDNPSAQGSYWEYNGSEAVLVEIDSVEQLRI